MCDAPSTNKWMGRTTDYGRREKDFSSFVWCSSKDEVSVDGDQTSTARDFEFCQGNLCRIMGDSSLMGFLLEFKVKV